MIIPRIITSGEVVGPGDELMAKEFVCDAAALRIVLLACVVDTLGFEAYDSEAVGVEDGGEDAREDMEFAVEVIEVAPLTALIHDAAAQLSQLCAVIWHVSLSPQVGQVGVVSGQTTQRLKRSENERCGRIVGYSSAVIRLVPGSFQSRNSSCSIF